MFLACIVAIASSAYTEPALQYAGQLSRSFGFCIPTCLEPKPISFLLGLGNESGTDIANRRRERGGGIQKGRQKIQSWALCHEFWAPPSSGQRTAFLFCFERKPSHSWFALLATWFFRIEYFRNEASWANIKSVCLTY